MKKMRNRGDAAKLEMTPMIDVVFQLLIFFIVTLKQEDILSYLSVSRPQPSPEDQIEPEVEILTVEVGRSEWVLNGKQYSNDKNGIGFVALDRDLSRLASFSRSASVIIKCTPDSPHSNLVRLHDVCSREKMTNLSVFSI
jgi:biopolymer transport protein ExbD